MVWEYCERLSISALLVVDMTRAPCSKVFSAANR
jgi:hypothetical protein